MKVVLQNLTKKFPSRNKKSSEEVIAVNDFSFEIPDGKLIGLLGPSGCGKSTMLNMISGLLEPTSGRILYDGTPIYDSEKHIAVDMLPFRRKMQIIFQDPSASLDPRMTVGEIVGEALDIHGL